MRIQLKLIFYLLLAIGVSVAHAGAYEDFFRAVGVDDARTVKSLLERGFDPNAPDERGQSALFVAIRGESFKVADALLERPDTKVDVPNANGETPLMMAALRGRLDLSTRLVERGGAVNREGWTPLHYAASGPEVKVVAWLLDRGAALDALSPTGNTALMMAARYGTEDATLLLLARGADTRIRNKAGLTASDMARGAGRDALAARIDAAAR